MLPPAIHRWDIAGAAGVVAITSGIVGIAALVVGFWYVRTTPTGLLQAMLFPVFNATVMTVAVLASQRILVNAGDGLVLITSIAVGGLTYFGSVMVSSKFLGYNAPSDLIGRVRGAMG
jgi:hypothetical protein